jgi:hypothetical protein
MLPSRPGPRDTANWDTPDFALDGGVRSGAGAERNSEIMRESIRGAEGQNGERDGRAGQSLNDVVDGAIASAGKDGITAGGDGTASAVVCLLAGAANGKLGANSGGLDDADGMAELGVALFSTAARVGIEQNCGFAHASDKFRLEFNLCV